MTILIDARYIGDILHTVHHSPGVNAGNMARVMGVTTKMLHKYERGREIVPPEVLEKVIRAGVFMLMARQ